mgnify:CR=1 FL=1
MGFGQAIQNLIDDLTSLERLIAQQSQVTTGMQRSHTSLGTRLADVAKACGVSHAQEVFSETELPALAQRINARSCMLLAQVHIRQDEIPRVLPSRDGVYLKNRFREALGFPC